MRKGNKEERGEREKRTERGEGKRGAREPQWGGELGLPWANEREREEREKEERGEIKKSDRTKWTH